MICRTVIAVVVVTASVPETYGELPQLTQTGILVTEAASRSRLGGDEFYLGDLLYVQVVCPPNAGNTAVSAHLEFKKSSGEWVPVPTSRDGIGRAYSSGRYPGLRDYVYLRNVAERTRRNVSLFMPYEAAAIPNGTFSRRYVIRVWNDKNQDVARTVLPAEKIFVGSKAGRKTIKVVSCRACCSVTTESEEPLEPQPEAVPPGAVRYFDARTGKWLCPGKLERHPE